MKRILALAGLFAFMLLAPVLSAQDASTDPLRPLAWQIALDREGFSPGLLDNKPGMKTSMALADFLASRSLPNGGTPENYQQAAKSLGLGDFPTTTSYTITSDDVARVTGPLPKSWLAKSKMAYLGHASLAEAVAERFHCAQQLLADLNPGISLGAIKEGDSLVVPNVQKPLLPAIDRLEINLTEKAIRGFDRAGRKLLLFHCSIAKHEEKRPTGSTAVVTIGFDPVYRFDPAMWPEVKGINQILMIPPGPKNPVGMCWVGLGLKGYGMHGTPNPEMIGKTGSHGCFRLTNWDAVRLGQAVRVGTPVKFVY
ncbi:MAG: L,D-transpeptidase [Tepidisphaeraceae bacterium]